MKRLMFPISVGGRSRFVVEPSMESLAPLAALGVSFDEMTEQQLIEIMPILNQVLTACLQDSGIETIDDSFGNWIKNASIGLQLLSDEVATSMGLDPLKVHEQPLEIQFQVTEKVNQELESLNESDAVFMKDLTADDVGIALSELMTKKKLFVEWKAKTTKSSS